MNQKIFLAYIQTPSFSGQSASSVLLIDLLKKEGWECKIIPLYPFIRGKQSRVISIFKFLKNQFTTISSLFPLFFEKSSLLYINLGQSIPSFLRIGIWLLPYRLICPNSKTIISLNGSVFLLWPDDSLSKKIFFFLLKRASVITVVGNNQKNALVRLGINPNSLFVIPNTFDVNIEDDIDIEEKFKNKKSINILHLSLLIESKGFPKYLDALEIIALQRKDLIIEAILCGPLSFTSYCNRFKNAKEKTTWIKEKLAKINSSESVTIKWIKGAMGKEKEKIFRDADIFVFPTEFPVEAQPLVLLEAMASGCALITSTAGEILSTVDDKCAVIMSEISPEILANNISLLCENDSLRKDMAKHGFERVKAKFSSEVYLANWLELLNYVQTAK